MPSEVMSGFRVLVAAGVCRNAANARAVARLRLSHKLTCIFISSGRTSRMFCELWGLCTCSMSACLLRQVVFAQILSSCCEGCLHGVWFQCIAEAKSCGEDAINIYLELFASAPDGNVDDCSYDSSCRFLGCQSSGRRNSDHRRPTALDLVFSDCFDCCRCLCECKPRLLQKGLYDVPVHS